MLRACTLPDKLAAVRQRNCAPPRRWCGPRRVYSSQAVSAEAAMAAAVASNDAWGWKHGKQRTMSLTLLLHTRVLKSACKLFMRRYRKGSR